MISIEALWTVPQRSGKDSDGMGDHADHCTVRSSRILQILEDLLSLKF